MSFKVVNYYENMPLPEITENDRAVLATIPTADQIATMIGKMVQHKPPEHCTVLLLDVAKVNAGWKLDGSLYLPKYEDMAPQDHKKFINSRRDLLTLKVTKPPHINIAEDGTIGVLDGRNRFCNLRTWEVKIMPFIVYNDDVEQFQTFRAYWYECPTCGDILDQMANCANSPHP